VIARCFLEEQKAMTVFKAYLNGVNHIKLPSVRPNHLVHSEKLPNGSKHRFQAQEPRADIHPEKTLANSTLQISSRPPFLWARVD
jgi:hypothetical protein